MALPKALEPEYIIGNIFVNILSFFQSLAPARKVFNCFFMQKDIIIIIKS